MAMVSRFNCISAEKMRSCLAGLYVQVIKIIEHVAAEGHLEQIIMLPLAPQWCIIGYSVAISI
jgi:hypothetical protein